jgi:hypothetical protein
MVESKTMKELREIKRKISKEISKISWEETATVDGREKEEERKGT